MPSTIPSVSRNQLARVTGNDHDLIRAFEALFAISVESADLTALTARVTVNEGDIVTLQTDLTSGSDPGHTHTSTSLPTSVIKAIETVTAASDTLDANNYTVLADCSSNAITLNLPAAASSDGQVYHIKKIDSSANAVTVDGNGSEEIDGATTQSISTQHESITIQCDGSSWWIL